MKNIIYALLLLTSVLRAGSQVQNISELFSEASVNGNVRYYYIQTDKEFATANSTSAFSNSLGGQLHIDSASLYGVSAAATFMTTNPFLLAANVDTSLIGKDNGARGLDANAGFSVLGEAYLKYQTKKVTLELGRMILNSPLENAKDVRMLPSSVSGFFSKYVPSDKIQITASYIDGFKQRTSSEFMNIVKHALGDKTKAITGSDSGALVTAGGEYKNDSLSIKAYDYFVENFINSLYLESIFHTEIAGEKFSFYGQYMNQRSIGNTDRNLINVTGQEGINSNAFGAKVEVTVDSSKFGLAYTKVLTSAAQHDSLVVPWDGTPLFTNMITSNSLFESIYGKGLNADSLYIGGSAGIKIFYKQDYDSYGLKGVSTMFSYLNIENSRFSKNQEDHNAVVTYKHNKNASIALKGMWVKNNSALNNGMIQQHKLLSQYRVIANYYF